MNDWIKLIESWYAAWHEAFKSEHNREPTIKETFCASWEYQEANNQGYSVEECIEQLGTLISE